MADWTLVETDKEGHHHRRLQLKDQCYLVLREGDEHLFVSDDVDAVAQEDLLQLTCITLGPYGVKLEALDAEIFVQSGTGQPEPDKQLYFLSKRTSEKSEIILLRKDDLLAISKVNKRFTLLHNAAEVQVNSSVPIDAEVSESDASREPRVDDALFETLENGEAKLETKAEASDTEDDDDDLDQPVQPEMEARATPVASVPRTQVVQETPAAKRVLTDLGPLPNPAALQIEETTMSGMETFSTAPARPSEASEERAAEECATEQRDSGVAEEGPTAVPSSVTPQGEASSEELEGGLAVSASPEPQTKPQKPYSNKVEVQIPLTSTRKRASPDIDAPSSASATTPARPAKRQRKSNAAEDINGSIKADTPSQKTAASRKGRLSNVQPTPSPQPSNASQSSVKSENKYKGLKPVVAFSNSTLLERPAIMKFFKSHGGTTVDAIKEGQCNVLCVRDAPLKKSTKLLLAMAIGIPIVTEKWLSDSAKKKQFLSQHNYIPSNPEQEDEWNYSLRRIWSQKQPDLFKGYTIYFTPTLKQHYDSFKDIEYLCKLAGARRTMSKPGREVMVVDDQTILLGLAEKDPDSKNLVGRDFTCFSKDFLTFAIMRGEANMESDEFKITAASDTPKQTKRTGRPRKS